MEAKVKLSLDRLRRLRSAVGVTGGVVGVDAPAARTLSQLLPRLIGPGLVLFRMGETVVGARSRGECMLLVAGRSEDVGIATFGILIPCRVVVVVVVVVVGVFEFELEFELELELEFSLAKGA